MKAAIFLQRQRPSHTGVGRRDAGSFCFILSGVGLLQVWVYCQQRRIMGDQLLTEHRAFVNLKSIRPEPKETEFGRGYTFWAFLTVVAKCRVQTDATRSGLCLLGRIPPRTQ